MNSPSIRIAFVPACLLLLGLFTVACSGSLSAGRHKSVAAAPATTLAMLSTTDGATLAVPDAHARFTVVVFVAPECPISNAYVPELNRMKDDYTSKPVSFAAVYPNQDLSAADARQHQEQYQLTWACALDPQHRLVHALDVRVTPEAVIVASDGSVLYRGRIDDRFADLARPKSTVSTRELRDSLDAALENRPIATPRTDALGCYIESQSPKTGTPP